MRCQVLLLLICFTVSGNIGCGPKQDEVEIKVTDSLKAGIEAALSENEYSLFALKTSYPKTIEEVTKSSLFVAGKVKKNADIQLVTCSLEDLNAPLFTSISNYFVNPNMLSGGATFSGNISVQIKKSGKKLQIPIVKKIYGKNTTMDTLIQDCYKEMQKNENSVLMISKTNKNEVFNQMVRIVFK